MASKRVLVVGTTADYIDLIRRRYPGRALFLTDPGERERAAEDSPVPDEEILGDLTRAPPLLERLRTLLDRFGLTADGVACFDCESLGLAAELAGACRLPFPLPEAVALCRNKFLSKQAWQAAGVDCPRSRIVQSTSEAVSFLEGLAGPVILKPLTGSGGELVFRCDRPEACRSALATMQARLGGAGGNRMYMPGQAGARGFDPLRDVVIEEFIPGREFSCDFLVENDRLTIIRTAAKVPASGLHTGATAAYLVPASLPPEIGGERFRDQLHRAARALGLTRAICMVDFMVWRGRAYLLELTPRPGGDCLPWLIRQSSGLDMLGLALDFAQGRDFPLPGPERWERLAGLRLFARQGGIVRAINDAALREDGRVREVFIKRRPGHRVTLPPEDYDSRLLGHVVFKPLERTSLEDECSELADKLLVEMQAG
jgi:hypothetical protein